MTAIYDFPIVLSANIIVLSELCLFYISTLQKSKNISNHILKK